jgi:hypothetical protein
MAKFIPAGKAIELTASPITDDVIKQAIRQNKTPRLLRELLTARVRKLIKADKI